MVRTEHGDFTEKQFEQYLRSNLRQAIRYVEDTLEFYKHLDNDFTFFLEDALFDLKSARSKIRSHKKL